MGINFPTVDDKAMYPRAKMKATFDQLWPSLFSMTQELEGVKIKGVNVIPKVILRKLTKDQIARLSNTVRIRRPGPRSRRFRKAVITSDSDSDGGSLPDSGEPTNFSYFSDDDDEEAEAALQNPSSRFGPSKENVGKEAVPKLNNEKNTSKSSDKVDQEILMRVTNLKDKEFLYNTDESSPNPVNSFIKALAEGTNSFSKSSERVHQKRNVNFDKAFDRVHREVISTGKGGHESRKESVLSSNKLNEKWASSSKSASTTHQAKEVWKKPLPKNDKSSPGNNSKENAVKASKTRSLSSANKLASQHSTTSSKSNNNLSGDKVSTSESTSKDVARTKLGNSSSTEAKEKHVSELKTKDGLKEMLDTKPRISEKRKSSEDETVFSHSENKKGKKRKLSPARKAPPPNMVSVPSATIIEYVGLGKEIQIKKNLELSRGLKQPNVPKLKISTEPELRVSTEPALKASKEPALKASKEPALKALKEATLKASEEPAPKISTEPTLTISAASKSKASAEPPKVVIKEVVKKDDSLVSLPIMLVINTEEEKLSKETLDMKSIEDMKHVARTLSNILCKLKKHKLEVERELDDEVKKLKKKYDAKVEDVETNIKLYNEIDIELCSEIPKMYPGNELKTLNEELKSKIKDLFIHDMGEEEEQELKESTEGTKLMDNLLERRFVSMKKLKDLDLFKDEVLTRTGQDFSHNTLTKSSRNNTSETRRSSSEGEVTLNSLYPKKTTNDKDVVLLTPFRNKPCNFVSQLSKSSQSACTSLKHDLTLVHYVENSSPTYNLRSESNANKSVKGMSNDQNSDDKAFEKYSSLKKLADSLSRPSINTVVTLKKQPKKPLTLSGTENNTDTHSNKANASSEFSERAQIPTDSVTTMQGNVPKSSQPTLVSTIKDLNVKDRSVREETRAQQSQSKESANPKQAIIRTIPEANVEYFGQKTKETKGAANVQHSTDVSRSKETSHQKPNESFGAKVQSPSLTMGTRVGHEVTLSKAQPTLRVDQTPIRHNSVSNPVSSSVIHIGPSTPTNSGVIHVRPSTPTNSGVIHVRPSAPTSSGVIHVRPSTPTSSTITPLRQHRAIASKQPILNPTTSVQTSHYTAIKPMSTMTSARPIQQHVSISPIVSHITNAQHIPNTQPQHIPNAQPQHIPNAQPQHITNAQPQHIPNTQQQHIPNTQQQQISNVLPQAAHVQPQQVGQVPVQSHLALLQPHIGNIQPQLQVSRLQSQQLLITHSQQQIPQLQQVSQIQTSQPQQQFPLLLQQQPPSYHQAINQQQPQHQTYQISTQQQQQQQQQQHQTYQINTQPQQQLQQQQQPQLQQQQQQQQQQQPVYQQQSTYQPQMQYSHQYQISSNLTPQAHVDEHGNVVMKNIPMASKQQDEPQNKNQNSSLLKQILGEKSRPNLSASVQQQPSVSVSNQMFPIITSAISLARGNSPSPDLQTSEDIIDLSAKTCFLCGVEATILCCGQFVYCGPACKESDRDRHKQECRSKN